MSKPTLSPAEALEKIANGASIAAYTVVVDAPLDGAAAFTLRQHGVDIPDELITYADADLADDPDAEDEVWETITSVDLTVYLPDYVAEWLAEVDASEVVGQLIEQFYVVHQEVNDAKGE